MSSRTVEVHRSNAMPKMEARNRAELIRMVFTSGKVMLPVPNASTSPVMRTQLL
ncbi:LuxR C-terminal-related transcriptional regulator [Rhizobium sp. NZLR11]|uniref:LuxR C-terminal-related transcriptional regulator n=1 Tax=Rhizobium sp. NZLR11 TaxID=2731098 RepID=UPI0038F7D06F